jgi:hypothetical protein
LFSGGSSAYEFYTGFPHRGRKDISPIQPRVYPLAALPDAMDALTFDLFLPYAEW